MKVKHWWKFSHIALECEGRKIPLNLAGNQVELYFTQQHLGDLRAALNALNSDES